MAANNGTEQDGAGRGHRWLRFLLGTGMLVLLAVFFMSGYTPPGVFGEVLRHNQTYHIDASPLFYSEVENMSELEHRFRQMQPTGVIKKGSEKHDSQ